MGQWATNCLTNNKSFNKLCGLHIKIERLSPLKHGHQLRNSPMPQLKQQDSAMWSCQQYCSAVSAQFSARSGHSLETWGVPPPHSPQLWVTRDGNITKAASVAAHGTYLFTLVAMFLAVCLRQFRTIVILIEAG